MTLLSLESILLFLFTVMCDVWVAVCQPFVIERIYDDDDACYKL